MLTSHPSASDNTQILSFQSSRIYRESFAFRVYTVPVVATIMQIDSFPIEEYSMILSKFSFGGTAAITTSMGLIAGLNFGEHAKASIIGGLLVIAIADNIVDSFSIHVYKESEHSNASEVFSATFGNFLSRLIVSLSFIALVFVLPKNAIVVVTSLWGLLLLTVLSASIARTKKLRQVREVLIHLGIAIAVVVISKYIGYFITRYLA
jgi:vacuolar iron transporter family protein